jgi:uncharacterized OB-fold protein
MQTTATPERVLALYDRPMWAYLEEKGALHLQCCSACAAWRYPPGPVCPDCLSPEAEWRAVSAGGEILSWVMFQKQYLPEYPAPYNVIAVRLDEGPIMISNLTEDPVGGSVIGRRVTLKIVRMDDGVPLPRFELDASA